MRGHPTAPGAGKRRAAWVTLLLLAAAIPAVAEEGKRLDPEPWAGANQASWKDTKALFVWLSGSKNAPDDAVPAGWTAARVQAIDEAISAWNAAQAGFGGLTLQRLPGLPGQPGATPMDQVRAKTDISINLADFRLRAGWGEAKLKSPVPGYDKPVVLLRLTYVGQTGQLNADGVKHLALHELGHALGVAHITSSPLMDGRLQDAAATNAASTTIGPDEKALLKRLWGSEAKMAESRVFGDAHFPSVGVQEGRTYVFRVEGKADCGGGACTSPITRVVVDLDFERDPPAAGVQTFQPDGWTGTIVAIPADKRPTDPPPSSAAAAVFQGGSIAPATEAVFAIYSPTSIMTVTYVHTVSAANDLDGYRVALTPRHTPGPSLLTATQGPGNDQVSLSWSAPASNGGSPVLRYDVHRDGARIHQTPDATVTSYMDGGRAPGARPCYKVVAVNKVGTGAASNERCVDIPRPPTAPRNLDATPGAPGSGTIDLTWDAPLDDGGKPILGYTIRRDGTAIASTADATVLWYTDTGRQQQVAYCYTVTATNSVGEGTQSNQACATIPGQCADGVDNDADVWTDHPLDPGCSGPDDTTEAPNPACSDGVDNDNDGSIDHPRDTGCSSLRDGSETADPPLPASSDAITRTFSASVHAEAEFKDAGLGVQSPTSPCPVVVFGVRAVVADLMYYQGGRAATNHKTGSMEWPTGGPPIPLLSGPCPIPGTGSGAPVVLTVPDTNLHGPYAAASVDQLVCSTAVLPTTCIPDDATAVATRSRCDAGDAAFLPSPGDGRSSLLNVAGSRSIVCPGAGFQDTVTYYDGGPTGYAGDWYFDLFGWGTDFSLLQNEDTLPLGDGLDQTGYLVTCLAADVVVVDPTAFPSQSTAHISSHDYLLVLDLDGTPENWGDALSIHWSNGLQGWHDLGGGNGFPCPAGADPPDKKGGFPIVPTLLSPD